MTDDEYTEKLEQIRDALWHVSQDLNVEFDDQAAEDRALNGATHEVADRFGIRQPTLAQAQQGEQE